MPLRNRLFLLFFLALTGLTAQTDSLGEWRTHHSYRFGTSVTQSDNSVIYSTGKAIFYLDKEDLSISTLAREDGLTQARVRLLRYHKPTETLIIVYESSVIDLYRNGQFSTLRQIDNFNFSGDKRIYEMFFGEDDIVYLATGFGVSALDLKDNTFPFTTFTGVSVNGVASYEGLLYAATDEGLYRVPLEGVNLNDFGNWVYLSDNLGLPGDYKSTAINVYRNKLYFGINDGVHQLSGDTTILRYTPSPPDQEHFLKYISGEGRLLMAGYRCTVQRCSNRKIIFLDEENVRRETGRCLFRTEYAIEDEAGRIWFAEDESSRFIRYLVSEGSNDCQQLEYIGPTNDINYRLEHDGQSLWVAPSVLDETFGTRINFFGVYRLNDGEWSALTNKNLDVFKGQDGVEGGDDDLMSIVDVHYDPVNQLHWFSSFYEGVIAYDEAAGTGEFYDEINSPLQNAEGDNSRTRVLGVDNDKEGFAYFANSRALEGNIITVRSPDGQFAALGGDCGINVALDIAVDGEGYVWVIHATSVGGGITVLDHNGTPLDPSDDRCRTILSNNSNLPTNNVRSIAVDLDGSVWVGTDKGVVLFECGDMVFNTERCQGRTPVAIDIDGNGFLLETEDIRSITVDGGNRKWIGTNGGAYLLSPDGSDQLLFFDQGNSPLLDNTVRDIAVDPNTGTVYFGTERGIISYRAEATVANDRTFKNDLVIFPNPVEPGYTGPVAINGLARDARVKITDLSGKLVAEGTATGGQFVWSGTDYNGRRVTSGVYMVFASTNSLSSGLVIKPESAVGKIVFIR